MSIDDINQLDVKERIILMNQIWESLESTEENIESPKWHKDILDERMKKLENGTAKFISMDGFKNDAIANYDTSN